MKPQVKQYWVKHMGCYC